MGRNPSCQNCKKEITDKENSYIVKIGKQKKYYCNEQCCKELYEKNKKIHKPKKIKENGAVNPRRKLTDEVQLIYLKSGFNKEEIDWGVIGKQIQRILQDHPEWNDEGLEYTLKYMYRILEIDVMQILDNCASIISILPNYYENANNSKEVFKRLEELYIQNGYDSLEKINWIMLESQLNNLIKTGTMIYSGIIYTLNYMVDILGMNLFSDQSYTPLSLVKFYYNEAKQFFEDCCEIEKLVENFEFEDKEVVIKKSRTDKNRYKEISMEDL